MPSLYPGRTAGKRGGDDEPVELDTAEGSMEESMPAHATETAA